MSAAYGLLGSVLVGAGLGYAVDHFAHCSPWGMLTGTLFGFGAGLYSFYTALMANSSDAPLSSNRPPDEDQPPS